MTINDDLPDIFKNTVSDVSLGELEQKALDVIADMSRKYIEWASNDVAKLKNIFEQIQNLTGPEQDALIRGDFYRTAHDIKGQGATFDYPLMSDLGAHLCTLIKTTDTFDETHLAVMAQDIEDMALVLAKKVQGEGGQIGTRISNRLKNG